eukprot:CAMPEP_0196594814 /NCGR_PEP_ID=MMETSP1081-20130531/79340_1 /TAXON_ID=36882 /ORGANISM="Pyramimonas amylifera, Strain CCMP720" /LENGTH=145 /DNA_ID=CAMNT_0041919171 /DNA_START=143 /DNA_END=580 /DNA_ORIENTATION=+
MLQVDCFERNTVKRKLLLSASLCKTIGKTIHAATFVERNSISKAECMQKSKQEWRLKSGEGEIATNGSGGLSASGAKIGDVVVVSEMPPFVKTAIGMASLRVAEQVINLGEPGRIMDRKPKGNWVVRFKNGAYLIDESYLKLVGK